MLFVRDKGQMCNNILQYAHVYAWARENGRKCMSMRFAYKYQFFNICRSRNHNFLMYVLGKYGAKCKLFPVVSYDTIDEDKTEKERFILSHRNVVVEGWFVRHYDLFLKYKKEIVEMFDFLPAVQHRASELIAHAESATSSASDKVRIGVHIRRGDYKTFFGGKYFFDDDAYIAYIRQTVALTPNVQHFVYICGNDRQLDRQRYVDALPDCHVVFPDGNPGEDLCVLSECDNIIGPPSSFSLVATMYGKARLCWMERGMTTVSSSDFKDFDTLFRIFDDYWV